VSLQSAVLILGGRTVHGVIPRSVRYTEGCSWDRDESKGHDENKKFLARMQSDHPPLVLSPQDEGDAKASTSTRSPAAIVHGRPEVTSEVSPVRVSPPRIGRRIEPLSRLDRVRAYRLVSTLIMPDSLYLVQVP